MPAQKLAERVAALEAEVARLRKSVEGQAAKEEDPWWKQIWGSFANDPMYEEAMRLGREYRESLRPKPRKRRKSRHGDS
jgi:hypothetical protein